MTAQQRFGARAGVGYPPRSHGGGYGGAASGAGDRGAPRRETARPTHAEGAAAAQDTAPVYIYGDRVCRKASKQRQLYKKYGQAAYFTPGQRASGGAGGQARRGGEHQRKSRRKIALETIINLFDSIDQRGREAVEAAKRNAIMRKKFLEHRRGFFLALLMIGIFAAFVLLVYNLFFGIRTIYAENTVHHTEAEIIAASGVTEGDKLYSFRADETERQITFYCPYIRSVDVTRTVPNRIGFDVESDSAAYRVNVYGEELVLSENLRVLDTYDPETDAALPVLCLPALQYAVKGRVILFADEKLERSVRDSLAVLRESGMTDRIGLVDLRDSRDIVMYCDGLYLLHLGGEKDLAFKLKMAEKTIDNEAFNQGTPAEIDLSVTGEACVRYDHTLSLSDGAAR